MGEPDESPSVEAEPPRELEHERALEDGEVVETDVKAAPSSPARSSTPREPAGQLAPKPAPQPVPQPWNKFPLSSIDKLWESTSWDAICERDDNGSPMLPTKSIINERFKKLYPGIEGLSLKKHPQEKLRMAQYRLVKDMVNKHWEHVKSLAQSGGLHSTPRVEVHSEFALGVFQKVRDWGVARDLGLRKLPQLPSHEEILTVRVLSSEDAHHKHVSAALAGTEKEYLLYPVPPTGQGSDSGTSLRLYQPRPPSYSPPPPPSSPPPSTRASNRAASSSTAPKQGHPRDISTLSNLVAQAQDDALIELGQSLEKKLSEVEDQQKKIQGSMAALKKAFATVECLSNRQAKDVLVLVGLFKRWKLQSQYVKSERPACAPDTHKSEKRAGSNAQPSQPQPKPQPKTQTKTAPQANTSGSGSGKGKSKSRGRSQAPEPPQASRPPTRPAADDKVSDSAGFWSWRVPSGEYNGRLGYYK